MLQNQSDEAIIDTLRESHHSIAKMYAAGMPEGVICRRTGYTTRRLNYLWRSPSFQQLIQDYKAEVFEKINADTDAWAELAVSNGVAAERHINDRIAMLDEANELLPLRDAMAIAGDAKDRFGYSKRVTQTNINVDIAVKMDKAIERSARVRSPPIQIEGHATEVSIPHKTPPQRSVSLQEEAQPVAVSPPPGPSISNVLTKQYLRR